MWLLDVNMPKKVAEVLGELGVQAETAESRGWGGLTNGSLVESAMTAGFTCVLTRDRLFGESAARALKRFRAFGVVLITIPQLRGPEFLAQFRTSWQREPIRPVAGALLLWPSA